MVQKYKIDNMAQLKNKLHHKLIDLGFDHHQASDSYKWGNDGCDISVSDIVNTQQSTTFNISLVIHSSVGYIILIKYLEDCNILNVIDLINSMSLLFGEDRNRYVYN